MEELRKAFRQKTKPAPNWKPQGDEGEEYARAWMRARDIEYLDIEQKTALGDALREAGAKRPDFPAKWPSDKDVIILFDAKHHDTHSGTTFRIRNDQLGKYERLEETTRKMSVTHKPRIARF